MKLFFALLFALVVVSSYIASAQEFTAEGEVSYKLLNSRNEIWSQIHKGFVISRNRDQWSIRTWNLNANEAPKSVDLFQEAGCDGTNIFWLTVQDTNKITKTILVSALGTVTEGVAPHFDSDCSLIAPIWLAYASYPYFKTITNNQAKHIDLVPDKIFENELVGVKWLSNPEAPEFIQSAVYHDTGMTLERMPNGEDKIVPKPAPFDKGFEIAKFSSDGLLSVNGLSVYTNFSLVFYSPTDETNTNSLMAIVRIKGILKNLVVGVNKRKFLPEIARMTIVSDKRFHVDQFNYMLTNGDEWLQKRNPKLNGMLGYYNRNYAKNISKAPADPIVKRFMWVMLILINVVLFVFFYWRLKSQTKT